MSEYKKYMHIEKIGNAEVEGIEMGTVYVFPKIDGSNCQIWNEENKIKFGSRQRELSLDNDNAGFMKWALENVDLDIFAQCLDIRLYGEWLVPHTLKTYRDDVWRKWYVFDVQSIGGKYWSYEEYAPLLDAFNIEYIPPLRILKNPQQDDLIKCLNENQYLVAEGKGIGEGIVLKNYEFVNRFGRQVWAKMVTSDFKAKHNKEMGAPVSKCTDMPEERLVDKYLTKDILDKIIANIKVECDGWSSKYIPRLLGVAYHDLVTEHIWDFVQKEKCKKIDFTVLSRFANNKIKQLFPEIF